MVCGFGCRYGAFIGAIPPERRVGDFNHCAARLVNAFLKRLEVAMPPGCTFLQPLGSQQENCSFRHRKLHNSEGAEVRRLAETIMKRVDEDPQAEQLGPKSL